MEDSFARHKKLVNNNGDCLRPKVSLTNRSEIYSEDLALLLSQVQSYLYLPDPAPFLLVVASIIANLISDNAPVWLMIVGSPSSGKSDMIYFVSSVESTIQTGTLTEAALLSGNGGRGKFAAATGGILKQIGVGNKGIMIAKDFTSVLSMNFEKKAAVFAAFREIYDGKWNRHLGTDGGQQLSWYGKVGFLGGVTDVIDSHTSVTSALGDRFIYCRMDQTDQDLVQDVVLDRNEDEFGLRHEIQYNTREFIDKITASTPREWRPLTEDERSRIKAAAAIASLGRSAVIRHPNNKTVEEVITPESPARLTGSLNPLYRALYCMGCVPDEAARVIVRAAIDCIPRLRARIIKMLQFNKEMSASNMCEDGKIDQPPVAIYRALEDMGYLRIVAKLRGGGTKGDSIIWGLHPEFIKTWEKLHVGRMSVND